VSAQAGTDAKASLPAEQRDEALAQVEIGGYSRAGMSSRSGAPSLAAKTTKQGHMRAATHADNSTSEYISQAN